MEKHLTSWERAERSIFKKYRKVLWNPFIGAVKRYRLIESGDRIAVCVSGGKDSMLLALLMELLRRYSEVPFEVVNLSMDPGYSPKNLELIKENAASLNLPLTVFRSNIFDVTNRAESNPCYLCARMRRGHLYSKAKELGCNKIALGHHLNDVIETTVMAMLYGAQLQGMLPKLRSTNFPGMELIRPLYCVREDDILAWKRYNGLEFLQCACRFTERDSQQEHLSKRKEVKLLLKSLQQQDPDIEQRIFRSIHAVNLDTFPGFKSNGELHSFLERYEEEPFSVEQS